MSRIIAAVDYSCACAPVLAVGRAYAERIGATLVAVHVREETGGSARSYAVAARVPFREVEGAVVDELRRAALEPDVVAVIVGARALPGGASPTGHIPLALITSLPLPVVVVPPTLSPRYRLRRLLVPLEEPGPTGAVRHHLGLGWAAELDLIVLHVHEPQAIPPFGDQPQHEAPAWRAEFKARGGPGVDTREARVETRIGAPADSIVDAARELDADLIVLGWAQDLSPGRADVVRSVLARSTAPVLLLPHAHGEALDRAPRAVRPSEGEPLPGVRM